MFVEHYKNVLHPWLLYYKLYKITTDKEEIVLCGRNQVHVFIDTRKSQILITIHENND